MSANLSHIRILAVLAVMGSRAVAAPASAQTEDASTDSEARGLFLAGQAAFEGGRFEEALGHFERSYELSERPELLYNIGTTAERLRMDERAIEAYELYLERMEEPPHRANVEGRLRVLRAAASASPPTEEEPPEARLAQPPSPVAEAGGSGQALGFGLGAAGLGLVAGGVLSLGLAVASKNAAGDVEEGTPWADVSADAARVDRRRAIGLGLLAVGLVMTTLGLVVLTTGSEDDPGVALRVGPSHLALEGRF